MDAQKAKKLLSIGIMSCLLHVTCEHETRRTKEAE